MKKRYWVTALIFFALGLIFYFFVYAYQFTGLMFCGLGVVSLILGAMDLLKRKIFGTIFKIALTTGLIAVIITGICIGSHTSGAEEPRADYVIVLGAGVNGTEPSVSLRERMEAAVRYWEAYPDAILILSGAQGDREEITEAECMYTWLISHGIPKENLRKEEQATTTQENIRYSLDLIEKESGTRPQQVGIISSEYHLLRASVIADDMGVEALCYPAETGRFVYFCNMFMREIFAVWKTLLLG